MGNTIKVILGVLGMVLILPIGNVAQASMCEYGHTCMKESHKRNSYDDGYSLFGDNVVYQKVRYIQESRIISGKFNVNEDGLGLYKLSLIDYVFPVAFDDLKVLITYGIDEIARYDSPGVYYFNVSNPGKYLVNLWGDTNDKIKLGLMGIEIRQVAEMIPTPLPGALVLLASGMLVLVKMRKNNHADDEVIANV
jgi:hypothetical protein